MSTRVYQFGCKAPIEGETIQRAQVRAAHDYRNQLVAIERGRRHALRAMLDTPEIRDAEETLKSATKSTRKAALRALGKLRRDMLAANGEETGRIAELDGSIRRDARALTPCYWGSYLTIEASADQMRRMPLYEDDGLTPNDPRFVRAEETRIGSGNFVGQIGVQIQGGLPTHDVLACTDTRVRLAPDRFADRPQSGHPWRVLWLRVGSDGRAPVWAKFPIRLHRQIPDAARWKWVRVSCRREATHAVWTCEITVDDPAPAPRSLDRSLDGAVAVEVEWTPVDGAIRVGTWRDHDGKTGEVVLDERTCKGIRKSSDIRAVRDLIRNDMAPKLARAMVWALPPDLGKAKVTMHLWLSLERFHRLYEMWSKKHPTVAPKALEQLREWVHRDRHLWQYADGSRGQALRRRREQYRVLAAEWGRRYRTVILDDRNLSREARWGEESDVRFVAGPSELRGALRLVFGEDATEHPWTPTDRLSETEDRSWCERAIDAWIAGGARGAENGSENKASGGNAWNRRKEKKRAKTAENGTAREPAAKVAE